MIVVEYWETQRIQVLSTHTSSSSSLCRMWVRSIDHILSSCILHFSARTDHSRWSMLSDILHSHSLTATEHTLIFSSRHCYLIMTDDDSTECQWSECRIHIDLCDATQTMYCVSLFVPVTCCVVLQWNADRNRWCVVMWRSSSDVSSRVNESAGMTTKGRKV